MSAGSPINIIEDLKRSFIPISSNVNKMAENLYSNRPPSKDLLMNGFEGLKQNMPKFYDLLSKYKENTNDRRTGAPSGYKNLAASGISYPAASGLVRPKDPPFPPPPRYLKMSPFDFKSLNKDLYSSLEKLFNQMALSQADAARLIQSFSMRDPSQNEMMNLIQIRNILESCIKKMYVNFVIDPAIAMPYLLFMGFCKSAYTTICTIDTYTLPPSTPIGIIDNANYPLMDESIPLSEEMTRAQSIVTKIFSSGTPTDLNDLATFKQVDAAFQTLSNGRACYTYINNKYSGPLNSLIFTLDDTKLVSLVKGVDMYLALFLDYYGKAWINFFTGLKMPTGSSVKSASGILFTTTGGGLESFLSVKSSAKPNPQYSAQVISGTPFSSLKGGKRRGASRHQKKRKGTRRRSNW